MKSIFVRLCFVAVATLLSSHSHAKDAGEPASPSKLKVDFQPAFGGHEFKRPIYLTTANDGSGRIYVMGQLGTVEVLDGSDDDSPETILDITDQVLYEKNENEQGLLGLAFHPNFKENRQVFLYYSPRMTDANPQRRSVVSRFTVADGKIDPKSESILLTVGQPYWNHNGGTIVFGPDRMLYIALGDGGLYDDPQENGQNPKTLLGTVLRIDVDSTSKSSDGEQLAYGIPKDNPFAEKPEAGRPEVWAYGLRNVWRMAFDRKTGKLWAGDVGQDKWEEIDILVAGGNYGWNRREGKHSFTSRHKAKENTQEQASATSNSKSAKTPESELIDPVLEYPHSEGKSITGGHVYRGQDLPELAGMYLYADYVTGAIYALEQTDSAEEPWKKHILREKGLPIFSFGEDVDGESYFMQTDGVIHRIVQAEE